MRGDDVAGPRDEEEGDVRLRTERDGHLALLTETPPGWCFATFSLERSQGDDPAITSAAIPAFPSPDSFAHHVPYFRLPSTDGLAVATARVNDLVVTTPEPQAAITAPLAFAAVAALRRRPLPPRAVRSAGTG